jgi:hypothetical protein
MLLLKFPELKHGSGLVVDRLKAAGADTTILAVWQEIVATDIESEDEEDEF